MSEQEKIIRLQKGFEQLCDQNKGYVIAISEALLFAQNAMKNDEKKNVDDV